MRAPLDDMTILSRDADAAVSNGFVRGGLLLFNLSAADKEYGRSRATSV